MDVEQVLIKLEDSGMIRTSRKIGNYMQIYCPFHNDGKERKPSCGVLLTQEVRNGEVYPEGFTHCFACSYSGTLLDTIAKLIEVKHINKDVKDWLEDNLPGFFEDVEFEPLVSSELFASLESKFAVESVLSKIKPPQEYVSEEELQTYRYTVPYMYERKLTDDIIERYDIGVDMNFVPPGRKNKVPCITFPVRDALGNTLFLCRRSISGKMYNYPAGVQKPLYGIDQIPKDCKSVVVCESCINALTAEIYGYDAVALLGTGNSYQIDQLKQLGLNSITLAMDGDDAGRAAARKLKRNLSKCCMVWTIDMPEGKDLNDLTKEEFDELYRTRE